MREERVGSSPLRRGRSAGNDWQIGQHMVCHQTVPKTEMARSENLEVFDYRIENKESSICVERGGTNWGTGRAASRGAACRNFY
jgi:hypothetical protein